MALSERVGPRWRTHPYVPSRIWIDSVSLSGIAAWSALIGATSFAGHLLAGRGMKLFAPPLFGHIDLRLGWRVLPAVGLAAALVAWAPKLSRRLQWSRLLVCSAGAAALWAFALSFVDGADALAAPLSSRHDYLATALQIKSVPEFISTFVARLDAFSVHVQGHPPGFVLLSRGLVGVGLSPGAIALLVVVTGASAVAAVLIVVRLTIGEATARRAGPFLVAAPWAIWVATSADALFTGMGAWGSAAVVAACYGRGRRSDLLAGVGGIALGCTAFMSYGLVLLWGIVLAMAPSGRRARPLLLAVGGVALVTIAFAVLGFGWWEGLWRSIGRYEAGVSVDRPYGYFVFANLAAFSLALGPAVAAGLNHLRARAYPPAMVCATLFVVMAADLSGLSKGEVERIWLPFAPWMLTATSFVPRGVIRWLLALQVVTGLALQIAVRSPW